MRVIQERDGNNTPTVSYTRGNDLSVSLQGAGGIGGLLARSSGYSSGNWTSHADYYADGNGNVTSLIDANQSVIASYRYDPFGNIISKSGTLADANVYRFSSKEVHVNSGMYYYGFRFYDPNLQRWINSDVLGDISGLPTTTANLSPTVESDSRGGMSTDELFGAWTDINRNLFAAMKNAPINYWDPLGLKTCNGDARVLQGNKNTVGKPGGFSGDAQHPVNVTAESAAVDPAQWGGKDRLRPNRDKISGIFTDSSGKQVGKFSGITDVIGGKPPKGAKGNVRDELKKLNPGKLIVELPGADKDLGTVHVTLTVPDDMNCPEGTK
jgi:RHS repeat-associated protein